MGKHVKNIWELIEAMGEAYNEAVDQHDSLVETGKEPSIYEDLPDFCYFEENVQILKKDLFESFVIEYGYTTSKRRINELWDMFSKVPSCFKKQNQYSYLCFMDTIKHRMDTVKGVDSEEGD